ncbi:hypothetical protein ACVDG5_036670 [Mesorhizobium sp. ORM6]
MLSFTIHLLVLAVVQVEMEAFHWLEHPHLGRSIPIPVHSSTAIPEVSLRLGRHPRAQLPAITPISIIDLGFHCKSRNADFEAVTDATSTATEPAALIIVDVLT